MKNIGKKIIFFFMIGILVFSLSLFAFVGCGIMKSITSSSSNGDTTIDNVANQTGNKGDVTAHQDDTNNPSEDTPNNENTYSTIGGEETTPTQPGNGNGYTDPQNDPDEGNIGGTGNPDTGAQSGTDNSADPNGNSGNTTEGNGENGNTPSGNESSGDIGNGGNTSDDPTPDDPQLKELDFSGLEEKLEEIAAQVQKRSTLHELISYSITEGVIYFLADITVLGRNRIILYKTSENNFDASTNEQVEEIINTIDKSCFEEVTFLQKTSADIIVDGVIYSKEGIEGDNPFARQCGVENAWMTYVSDLGGEAFSDFETGRARGLNVLTIYNEDEEIKTNITSFSLESHYMLTEEEVYSNLFKEDKRKKLEEVNIALGKNLKTPQVARQAIGD